MELELTGLMTGAGCGIGGVMLGWVLREIHMHIKWKRGRKNETTRQKTLNKKIRDVFRAGVKTPP